MEMPEKLETIKENRLCFACLRPNHMSKQCKRRMQCRRCGRMHPTLLHDEKRTSNSQNGNQRKPADSLVNQPKLCGATMPDDSNAVLPVLPVHVKVPNKTPVNSYAFLDTGSQTTFITDNLRRKLKQTGKKTSLTISNFPQ